MAKHVSFNGADVQVLTLVYAVRGDTVLTLQRAATKKFLPNWLVGLGGKVEAGENVFEGAAREFEEETGMRAKNLSLRGTYTFMTEMPNNRCGVIYIFVTHDIKGTFQTDVEDGTLHWMTVPELLASDKVMPDHKVWLGRIFESDDHFACVGSWEEGAKAAEWADSIGFFARAKAA